MRRSLLAVLDHDFDRAEGLLAEVVRQDSQAIDAYLALARLYRQRGELGRAIQIHQNLLLRSDLDRAQHFEALLGLAEDFRRGGFLRRAVAAYEEARALEPRHPEVLRALVRLFVEMREPQRALALERKLARLEGRDPKTHEATLWIDLARAARAEGRTDEARRALRRALRRDRTCVAAWIELGELEVEAGRDRKALEAWRRVPALDPARGAAVYPRLEASFAALGRARDFEAMLRELLESNPEDVAARLALARALAARGETKQAIDELESVLARRPGHLGARAALGRILLSERRHEEALRAYAELLDQIEGAPPEPELGAFE